MTQLIKYDTGLNHHAELTLAPFYRNQQDTF